jgi:hypothetical protein
MPALHHRKPFPMRLATGHATADRMAAGVLPRTSVWTTTGSLTPSAPRPWAVNCLHFRKFLGASLPQIALTHLCDSFERQKIAPVPCTGERI